MALPGVGRKVADCVALFSLDQSDTVPVDTHVWQVASRRPVHGVVCPHEPRWTLTLCARLQIAGREFDPSLQETKTLTPKVQAQGNWGKTWSLTVHLFTEHQCSRPCRAHPTLRFMIELPLYSVPASLFIPAGPSIHQHQSVRTVDHLGPRGLLRRLLCLTDHLSLHAIQGPHGPVLR